MSQQLIPFNRPHLPEAGIDFIREAFEAWHVSGNGMFTRRCQDYFERKLGAPRVLLTTSCTDALEMCALLLNLQPGDEVIMPAFTFVSTANAFALRGARPVFADIRSDTLNLDETKLEAYITSKTKAIVVVHYAGVGCEMNTISAIAARRGIEVIEDNAHGVLGTYRGKPLGTFGTLAALSFHETKNLSCGEGGALIINDERLTARAEIFWEKGTDRSRFYRGEVDRYTWQDLGSSFLPSDILAALLWSQIGIADSLQEKRANMHRRYSSNLHGWALEQNVQLPMIPPECESSHHLFYLLLPTPNSRSALIRHLEERGIVAVFHYEPLHTTAMGQKYGGASGQHPVTESISRRLVRLPFFTDMSESDQNRVIEAVDLFRT